MVRLRGADSLPVPGARVVLHRVGRERQGPIDSSTTDAAGAFRFRFPADTSAVFLVSARWGGIEYFSPPVHLDPERPDTALRVVAADTSSTAPVALEARHLVVGPPGSGGARGVLDVIVLRNPGDRTRVAGDSTRPSWAGALPSGSTGLELGEGEYSPAAVTRSGDRLLLFAPIAPGARQLVVEYTLPADLRATELVMEQSTELLNLLLAEPGAEVRAPGLALADTQVIEGRSYRRWTGAVAAGTRVRITFPGPPLAARWLLPALVTAVGGALALAALWLGRRAAAGPDPAAAADALVAQLAGLDARYRGREADTPPEEWQRYREERGRLKARLEAALRSAGRALALGLAVLLAAGCGRGDAAARGLLVVDDAGDSVTVAAPVARVVSLIPATTELLFAIGAGQRVVGRTAWCDYPAAAAAVPSLGDGISPNLEAIIAQRPDLVLLYTSGQNTETVERLEALRIPVLRLRTDSLADVPRLARLFGRLTGRAAAADSLARAFDAELAAATVAAPSRRPAVFLLVWDQPPLTVGRGSFLTELMERAGGANVFGDIASSSGAVSIEAVAARDPDVVLTFDSAAPAFASRPEWRVVPAVRQGRFIHAVGSEFSRPSPRAPAAVRRLAAALHAVSR